MQGAGGAASDGKREAIQHEPAKAQGERVEECGGETARAEVSGIQLYEREGAEAQDCAESNRPIQRADSGNHGKEQGEEHGEGDGGTGPVCVRLARLFRLLRNPFGVAGFGFVDQKARTDRKSTRLNSSHLVISYAVFCL